MVLPRVDKYKTGDNIKRLMRLKKIDAFELSQILGLRSTTSVYQWCQGKIVPNADSLVKLARIFNCTCDDILIVEEGNND